MPTYCSSVTQVCVVTRIDFSSHFRRSWKPSIPKQVIEVRVSVCVALAKHDQLLLSSFSLSPSLSPSFRKISQSRVCFCFVCISFTISLRSLPDHYPALCLLSSVLEVKCQQGFKPSSQTNSVRLKNPNPKTRSPTPDTRAPDQ